MKNFEANKPKNILFNCLLEKYEFSSPEKKAKENNEKDGKNLSIELIDASGK